MLVQIASSFISIHMPEASKTILCIAVSRIGHECKNNIDHGCAAAVMASTPTSHSAIFLDSINSRLSNEYPDSDSALVAPTIAVDFEGLAHELELDADTLVEKLGGTHISADGYETISRTATPLPTPYSHSETPDLYRTLAVVPIDIRNRPAFGVGRDSDSPDSVLEEARGRPRGRSASQQSSRSHSRAAEEREPLLVSPLLGAGACVLDLQGLTGDDHVTIARAGDGVFSGPSSGTSTPRLGGQSAAGAFVAGDLVVTFPGDTDTAYIVPVLESERWGKSQLLAGEEGLGPSAADQYLLLVPRDEAPVSEHPGKLFIELPPLPSVPTAVQHVDVYLEGPPQYAQLVMSVQLRTSLLGYAILFTALVTVSSMGAVTKTVAATETIAGSWRSQVQCLSMLPFAAYQMLRVQPWEWRAIINEQRCGELFWCSFGNFIWMLTFWIGLQYTTVTHAYLLNNCMCVFIYLRKLLFGYGYTQMEKIGVALVVVGALVAITGTAVHGEMGHTGREMVAGDVVAFAGALGGVAYVVNGKELRQEVPLFMYMLPVNVFLLVFGTFVAVVMDGATWDRNLTTGLFAWATRDYCWQGVYLGVVTGLVGSVAYIACLRFVSPLVVAVVMSSEPIVSGVIATMLHFDQPDAWTAAGGAILIGGCLLVVWSERERKVTRNISEFVGGRV